MAETMYYTGTLAIEECYKCHITFAMPADFQRQCKQQGETFYCPLGHAQVYATSEVEKLKARLAREEEWRKSAEARATHERDQRQAAERTASAYKGQATRLRKRATAGVCPVPECHRHFANLERHVASKHPDFAENGSA
jgi:hypothetical protein